MLRRWLWRSKITLWSRSRGMAKTVMNQPTETYTDRRRRTVLLEALIEPLPVVDEEEQLEIERMAGKPGNYNEEEFVDWIGK